MEVLAVSRADALRHPFRRVAGVILRIERVRPPQPGRFRPNRASEITPAFLEAVVVKLRRRKYEIISLDEMHQRLVEPDRRRPRFVCFTCDGGYADHRAFAHPIFRKHGAPFAAFIPTGFPDRIGEHWWLVLEAVIAKTDRLAMLIDDRDQSFDCRTVAEKNALFEELSSWLWARPSNDEISRAIRDLAARYGVDVAAILARTCMGWDDIRAMAADPLATIGTQTINYPILAKLPDARVRSELAQSRTVIESAIGARVDFLAYPFGHDGAVGAREFAIAGELGFKAALTSQAGPLVASSAKQLMALPRVTLPGEFQRLRFLRTLMAGLG
jgi:peptidoglycan/xylan/chitin deacetylase (PgdA/CDA1 family)